MGDVVSDGWGVVRQRIWKIRNNAFVTLGPYLILDGRVEHCTGCRRWNIYLAACLKYYFLENRVKGTRLGDHSRVTVSRVALMDGRYHL